MDNNDHAQDTQREIAADRWKTADKASYTAEKLAGSMPSPAIDANEWNQQTAETIRNSVPTQAPARPGDKTMSSGENKEANFRKMWERQ